MQRTVPILTNDEDGYIRIIPTRFGKIQLVVLEEMAFETSVDEGRHTTDDGHPKITIAHLEPLAQVSSKEITINKLKLDIRLLVPTLPILLWLHANP